MTSPVEEGARRREHDEIDQRRAEERSQPAPGMRLGKNVPCSGFICVRRHVAPLELNFAFLRGKLRTAEKVPGTVRRECSGNHLMVRSAVRATNSNLILRSPPKAGVTTCRPRPTCTLNNPISGKPEIGGWPRGASWFETRAFAALLTMRLAWTPQDDGRFVRVTKKAPARRKRLNWLSLSHRERGWRARSDSDARAG